MAGERMLPEAEQPLLIVRLMRRFRPREGWAVLACAWAAAICPAAAAVAGQVFAGVGPLAWLATLALLGAWWLAHRRVSGLAATGILALAAVAADLLWGVRVMRMGPLFGQVWRWLVWFLGERAVPAPAVRYFQEQGAALATFGRRLAWWISGLVNGQGLPDNLVTIGVAGLLAWGLAAWAGWWVARQGKPFLALLPSAVVLALQVYWAEDARWVLLVFLGAMTLLLASARLAWFTAIWERCGTDYSPEIKWDVWLIGAGIAWVALLLAPTLPFLTSARVAQAFWRLFESPYRQVEQRLGQSFASLEPVRSLAPAAGLAAGGMPRAHLLGGRPELSETVVFTARERGAQPGEVLYWRGQTFAHYTGHGWDENERALTEQRLAAGEPWAPAGAPQTGRPLVNMLTLVEGSRAVLYAAGEPVSVDRPYNARLRAPGELVALSAPDGPARYTILSQVIALDPAALAAAGQIYPTPVISLYLQLPLDLDPRLAALAAQWTGEAATPYARALAIEAALRQMPYTLEVPVPPADRETITWFLFDLRRGYCDYFASAMVVLARLSGIPARLAVGYAAGSAGAQSDQYTVTEFNAHAWPELYFPGVGWVRFEPTPAQPAPERLARAGPAASPADTDGAGDFAVGMAELRAVAAANAAAGRRQGVARGLAAALNGLLLVVWLVSLWAVRRRSAIPVGVAPEVAASYDRLAHWGARLGRPVQAGETPREYTAAITRTAAAIAGRARWPTARAAAATRIIGEDAALLTRAYERALFAPEAAAPSQRVRLSASRPGLWAVFWRLWLARVFARPRGE